jgi:hypothetical protein
MMVNAVTSLAQGSKPIDGYVKEAERLYQKCRKILQLLALRHRLLAGLNEAHKIELTQLYLGGAAWFTFRQALLSESDDGVGV